MTPNPIQAINPEISATVSASAGTGKTWLLVSRLLRLLLNNTDPQTILAITFTRKAAAEMQSRLNERLLQMATCTNTVLDELLQTINAPLNESTRIKARNLYEQLLQSPRSITITTFHAFCQDLLKRFPFEADVPPGFELAEQTADLETEAWDALVNETTQDPDGNTATALEVLFDYCNGLPSTQSALRNFLQHRSDWWAYTYQQQDPVVFASDYLRQQMDINPDIQDPVKQFFNANLSAMLREFSQLLEKHPIKKNLDSVEKLALAQKALHEKLYDEALALVTTVFFTDKNQPRIRKASNTQKSKMGETGEARFLQIHDTCCKELQHTRDILAKLNTYRISCAWYQAGNRLLTLYQLIKKEKRILDFTDLEWNAFRLLHEGNNASWVQYKLDARINHFLIDEFQDTNPTQWQLLYPLLQELASSIEDSGKSVFLVGDVKQSIYRFRRAQPELFDAAQDWMHENLNALTTDLDTSRRSAKAIVDCVNTCFSEGKLNESIRHFKTHQTVHDSLWGCVECIPLFTNNDEKEDEPPTNTELRNPLLQPRPYSEDQRYQHEAAFIADKIKQLVDNKLPVTLHDQARTINFSDIIILLRHRTHAHFYQRALMQSGIPYVGTERGTLLEAIEVRDIVCLLESIIAPYNNLSMATVLRSPIFALDDDDLIQLATIKEGFWFQRLQLLADQENRPGLTRARDLISQWRTLVETVPVHDLLDKIYCDCNLIARYQAAFPQHLRLQVKANLLRFIELALEIDSGRYPSIGRFLFRIKSMRASEQDAPDETPAGNSENRVRLLTIHASKGLEAPVIFLADSANTQTSRTAYHPLIHWPAGSNAPLHFLMAPKKTDMDPWSQVHLDRHLAEQQREETNLLYVALTRARQVLYISGCEPRRSAQPDNKLGWYGLIRSRLETASEQLVENHDDFLRIESAVKPVIEDNQSKAGISINPEILPGLRMPVPVSHFAADIAPSQVDTPHGTDTNRNESATGIDEDLQQRGITIHKMIELLTQGKSRPDIFHFLLHTGTNTMDTSVLEDYFQEAENVYKKPEFQYLFNEQLYDNAYNEVAIHFEQNNRRVYGIIDRIALSKDTVHIIDYKTHQNVNSDNYTLFLEQYQSQLSLYTNGVQQIWPKLSVKPAILFTHTLTLAPVPQG